MTPFPTPAAVVCMDTSDGDTPPSRGVEAACKAVVRRRMKCIDMRWALAGINPVDWVRCAQLSGRFDDYWEHRHRQAA